MTRPAPSPSLPADLDLTRDPGVVVLAAHAVRRYRERAEGVPGRLAVRESAIFSNGALAVPVARLDRGGAAPQRRHGYSIGWPDVCLLRWRDVLVTVLSHKYLRHAGDAPRARLYG